LNIPKITFIKINKREIIIIIALLILAFASYFIINNKGPGAKAQIEVAQNLYGTYDLSKDQDIIIKDSKGQIIMTAKISNGTIRVITSTCRDKICIKEGAIDLSGQTIVCLPNKVVITVINDNNQIDGVLK